QASVSLPRDVVYVVRHAHHVEVVWLVLVNPADGAYSIGREKLGLIQQVTQHPFQPIPRWDRKQPPDPAVLFPGAHARDVAGHVLPVLQEPVHPALEPLEMAELLLVQYLDGDKRHDPD